MSAVTALTDELLTVRDLCPDSETIRVVFEDGRAVSWSIRESGHPAWLRLCEGSRKRGHPVCVRLAPEGGGVSLRRAAQDVVTDIRHQADGTRVLFRCHAGVYRLRTDGGQAPALLRRLERSLRTQEPVWFAAEPTALDLLAVSAAEPPAAETNGESAK